MKGGDGNDGTYHHCVRGCSDPLGDRGMSVSVYIRGMEMPKSCYDCRFRDGVWCRAYPGRVVQDAYKSHTRDDDCPLIPVPDHGRLIDADALVLNAWYTNGGLKTLANSIPIERVTTAPTIIPADIPVMYYPQVTGITPTLISEDKDGAE